MIAFGFSALIAWWLCEKIVHLAPGVVGLFISILVAIFCGVIVAPAVNLGIGYVSFPEIDVVELIIGSWSLHALPVAVSGIWSGVREFRLFRKRNITRQSVEIRKGAGCRVSKKFRKLPISARALIVGSGAWIVLLQTFLLAFNPYECSFWNSCYGDSRLEILAVTFFPVFSLCVIYFAFHLVVRSDKSGMNSDKLDVE